MTSTSPVTYYRYPTVTMATTAATTTDCYYWVPAQDTPSPRPPDRARRILGLFWPPDKPGEPDTPVQPDLPAQPVRVHKAPRPGLGIKNYRKAA